MKELLSESEQETITKILLDELGVNRNQLSEQARLEADLGADSLTMIQISMALEEHLDLLIPDERAERIQTVGDIFEAAADLISSRR